MMCRHVDMHVCIECVRVSSHLDEDVVGVLVDEVVHLAGRRGPPLVMVLMVVWLMVVWWLLVFWVMI